MIREIATIGNPILRGRSRELSLEELASAEVQTLIDDMVETMRAADGAGLAAPQVSEPVRIALVEVRVPHPRYPDLKAIPLTVMVNPRIEVLGSERIESYEGCLSVPKLRGRVSRAAHIRIQYFDREGTPQEREARGLQAVAYQHECDHLDGQLFVDQLSDPRSLTTLENLKRFPQE